MLKKVLIAGLLAVVGVAGVVVVRAATFSSKQITVEPAPAIDIDVAAAAERLARAVRFKTISYQDPAEFDASQFDGLHAFLEDAFPRVHSALKKEVIGGWSLLYTWPGTDESLDPVMLMGHMDVVPVVAGTEATWEQEPFAGAIKNGMIYGRGTLDDKGNMLAILEAVEYLLAEGSQPERTLYFSFGHDEEVGGDRGAIAIAELLRSRGVRLAFVLDEGGAVVGGAFPGLDAPVASIGIAEKGYLSVTLSVRTPGGHSSQPPAETAIGMLSRAIYRLETNQMPGGIGPITREMFRYIGPEMGFGMRAVMANLWLFRPIVEQQLGKLTLMNAFMRTTTAPTIFHAGVKDNVLPPKATAVVNFRILPGDTREDVVAHIRKVVDDERVEIEANMDEGRDPSKVSPSDGWAFETITRSVRETIPGAIVTPFLVIAGTDSRHFEIVTDNVYRFSPMTLEGDDLARIHGTDERVSVETYGNMIRFFHRLIVNAAF